VSLTQSFTGLKVVLVAKFNRRYHRPGLGIAAALQRLGCEVTPVELRHRGWHQFLGQWLPIRLRRVIRRRDPDLILAYKGAELAPEVIAALKSETRAQWVNWFPDPPSALDLSLRLGAVYDHCFLFDSWMVERHREQGLRSEFLPLAYDPAFYRPLPNPTGPRIAVAFAGSPEPERDRALATLNDLGLELWGPRRPRGPLYGDRLLEVFSRTDVGLNIHQHFGTDLAAGLYGTGANQRVFELAGMGCPQLSDHKLDIPKSFRENDEIVLFRTTGELREKAQAMLADASWRQSLATRAHARALEEHTWTHRIDELLTRVLR
jgi:spore maturation protein CgeB